MGDRLYIGIDLGTFQSTIATSKGEIHTIETVVGTPKDPVARKEYFSRVIHNLGRMEAHYESLTLLANTDTWTTNIFDGATMTIGSAGAKNYANSFNNKRVYDTLLSDANGNPVLKLLDGTSVRNRKQLLTFLEERGVIDNFIKHEFEYIASKYKISGLFVFLSIPLAYPAFKSNFLACSISFLTGLFFFILNIVLLIVLLLYSKPKIPGGTGLCATIPLPFVKIDIYSS